MSKGLRTKSERMAQIIFLTDPNVFDANGTRTVLQAADDYTYKPADSFDSGYRAGANAKSFNSITGRIRTGDSNGTLYYNLFDDQLAPYVWQTAGSDVVAGGLRTRIYDWAQMGRLDRPAFAVEEGAPDRALRGLNGHYNSFKFTSKRDQTGGTARVATTFTTTKATSIGAMTGSAVQNSVLGIVAANVTGDGVFAVSRPGYVSEQVTIHIADSTATIKAAFEALNSIDGVTVVGTVAAATGELHVLTALNAIGSATIYNTITVTPGMSAASLQTAIRALGGVYANVVVTATVTVSPSSDILTSAMLITIGGSTALGHGSNPDTVDNDNATYIEWGNAGDGFIDFDLGSVQSLYGMTLRTATNGGTYRIYGNNTLPAGIGAGGGAQIGADAVIASNTKQTITFATPQSYRYIRVFGLGNVSGPMVSELELFTALNTSVYSIQFPIGAGDVTDITATPGTGWSTAVTQPGNSAGNIAVTVTNPASTPITITKVSGAGYSCSVTQQGGNGSLRSAMRKPLPLLPQHLAFYAADTYAGLDLAAAYIGGVEEFVLDIPKIREPRMPHNQSDTYTDVVDVEQPGNAVEILLFADQNSPAKCAELVADGEMYVSKAMYFRAKATCPTSGYIITWEWFGSIGKTSDLEYNGNVEERRLYIDVLENYELDWNFRVTTVTPL